MEISSVHAVRIFHHDAYCFQYVIAYDEGMTRIIFTLTILIVWKCWLTKMSLERFSLHNLLKKVGSQCTFNRFYRALISGVLPH